MKDIQIEEIEIVGGQRIRFGKMKFDKNSNRINWLVENKLEKVAVDDSGWQTLYFHSKNDSYWERTYPKGDMHGGGPPRLRKVAFSSELKSKYGI